MTTLNTIIEEEKVKFGNLYVEVEEVMERSVLDKYERFLTTAMQRAYEAGKASNAQENTPDTEDWEKEFDEKFGWLKRSRVTGAQLYDHMMLKHFITSLLTSRDTYWKERVLAVLAGHGKGCDPRYHAECIEMIREAFTNEDNLK